MQTTSGGPGAIARFLPLLLLGLLAPQRTAMASGRIPIEDRGPFPVALKKLKPDYPVALWKTGQGDIVHYSVRIDSTGAVTDIDRNQGWDEYAELALAALRQWRYGPAMSDSRPVASNDLVMFWFDPEQSVWFEEEDRILDVDPQVLLPVPFSCPDPVPSEIVERYSNDFVGVNVDKSGFVRDVRFFMSPPPDSEAVRAIARRWIFRPLVAPDGPKAGHAIPFWASIRVDRSCCNRMTVLARPDSAMLATFEKAPEFSVGRLHPSPLQSRTLEGSSRALPHATVSWSLAQTISGYRVLDSETESYRSVPADSVAATLRAILADARSYDGSAARKPGRRPEPRYVFKWWDYELLVSPDADVLHVWSRRVMLEVPYAHHRREMRALLHAVFGE